MMIQILGWLCTALVVFGFWLNAKRKHAVAMYLWVVGDIGWIIYDYLINNWSHAALSGVIITINIYGYYRIKRRVMSKARINRTPKDLFIGS